MRLLNLGPIDDAAYINYNERKIARAFTDIFSGDANRDRAIEEMENEFGLEFARTAKEAINTMCNWNEVFEERGRIEGAEQAKQDNALRMIADGELTLEKIASYTDLPLEKVQELAAGKSA